MDTVTCYCLKCEEQLGRFHNSWNGIGKTYFSPVDAAYAVLGAVGLEAIGDFRSAEPGTRIEKSLLQDLACKKCKTVVGMRCESAPKGNILKRDQLILRLKAMTVLSDKTGIRTAPIVLKTYSLLDSGSSKSSRRVSGPQPAMEDDMPPVKQTVSDRVNDIERREFTKFAEWTEDVISAQRKDIDRIDGAVGRIERDMQSFKEFMVNVRKELDANRRTSTTSDSREIAILQRELEEIRQQLDRVNRISNRDEADSFELSREHAQKMVQTAAGVGSLKAELNTMKNRLKHVEETTRELRPTNKRVEIDEVALATSGQISRNQAAMALADDLHEQGEREMATRILSKALGKRKVSEIESGTAEPLTSTTLKKTNRGSSNKPTNPSSSEQARYASPTPPLQESPYTGNSFVTDPPVRIQGRRPVGRPRKVAPTGGSYIDADSGEVDGRSLRRRKSNFEPSQQEKRSRGSRRTPEIINLEDDNEGNKSSSNRRAFQPSVRSGLKNVLASIENEDFEQELKRRRLEAREALAKEILERQG